MKIKIIFNENESVYFMKYFNFFNEHDFWLSLVLYLDVWPTSQFSTYPHPLLTPLPLCFDDPT